MKLAAAAALLLSACGTGGGMEAQCESKVSLVDHGAWTVVPAERDPYAPPPDAGPGVPERGRCLPSDMMVEDLNGEQSLTISTNLCSWATVEQPAKAAVAAGDRLTYRVWYYSQTRFELATAEVDVTVGDGMAWNRSVPLPAPSGGLLFDTVAAASAAPAGTPVRWHVSNHGQNTWNILEVSATRTIPCSQLAKGDAGANN